MEAGSRFELRIDRLAGGGEGVGRAPEGRVVFVPSTAPGDRIRVRVTEVRRSYARGEVDELLEPGPERVEPACPAFGACGGCAWQHLSDRVQVEAKAQILAEAFARIGRLILEAAPPFHASPLAYGYRSRARVLVSGGRVGFRRRRSRDLCETAACPVLVPALQARLVDLAARPPARDGEWELFAGDDGTVRAVPLHDEAGPAQASLRARPTGDRLEVSPGVFAQGNAHLRDRLADRVLEAAGEGRRALELFAGAGFLTVGLARRFATLTAVESNQTAVRDLRANLSRAGLAHVRVVAQSVERFLSRRTGAPRLDTIVLDPPRTGLAGGAARRLAGLAASRVVYLSCDPATLARDAADIVKEGYRLVRVEGFDLFPQTPHVEALAVLERR